MNGWSVAAAKAKLSEVVNRALSEGPQLITRNGREAVVVVSVEEWARRTKRAGSLVEFFSRSPLRGSKLKLERSPDGFRPVDL